MQAPAEEGMVENQIVEEFRKGYLFKDKVLRASMVKVVQKG
jgi:molecular chaperone GrpE (heat shock protein)